jgi:hypothetical protein
VYFPADSPTHGMNGNTVLMYHAAIPEPGSSSHYDPHYSVSREAFGRHLRIMCELGQPATSVHTLRRGQEARGATLVTFDDASVTQ